ncbi:hypothetical protein [uncultured Croceitalea sp.]
MKRVLSILAIAVMTIGFYSCEAESTTEEEQLFIEATDGDNSDVKDRG